MRLSELKKRRVEAGVGPHNFPGDPPAALPVKILSPALPPSTQPPYLQSATAVLPHLRPLQSCASQRRVTSGHSCKCIACIPAIEVKRAVHNSAHLIDTVPPSRVQIHAVPWRKFNPMEAKVEAKSGQTSGRYSTEVNAIRVRSQDICSGHGPHLKQLHETN